MSTDWNKAKVDHEYRKRCIQNYGASFVSRELFERFTKPAAPEWDDGFPKVHTDCLMADDKGVFQEVRIVSWVDGYVIGWCANKEQVYFSNDTDDFHPLRTKEQRERDELVKLLDDCQMEMGSFWTPERQADAIIAAGWRKGE